MRRIAIDTNIYAAFKSNEANVVQALRKSDFIGVDMAVVAELYYGFSLGTRKKENRRALEAFFNSPRVAVLPHTVETAEYCAFIVEKLRLKGKPIPTNACG